MQLLLVASFYTAACVVMGLLVAHVFHDFSKNSGWIIDGNSILHVVQGAVVGLLILPVSLKWEVNLAIPLIRQLLGVLVFVAYTFRNVRKHTKHLKFRLARVNSAFGSSTTYTFFRTSVTRNQLQLGLGIGLSILGFASLNFPLDVRIDCMSITFFLLAGEIVVHGLVQFVCQHERSTAYEDSRAHFIERWSLIKNEHPVDKQDTVTTLLLHRVNE